MLSTRLVCRLVLVEFTSRVSVLPPNVPRVKDCDEAPKVRVLAVEDEEKEMVVLVTLVLLPTVALNELLFSKPLPPVVTQSEPVAQSAVFVLVPAQRALFAAKT